MKVGIITFSDSNDNYGQLLQCWALQAQIKELGHDAYIIRYERNLARFHKKSLYKIFLIYPVLRIFIIKTKLFFNRGKIKKLERCNKLREFNRFRDERLNMTNTVFTSLKQLKELPPEADIYVAGSDSIWAQLIDKEDNKAFFLDFGDSKIPRISYASSFLLKEYPARLEKTLKYLLERFNAISVREPGGVDICSKIGLHAEITCDPSLLFDINEYKSYFKVPNRPENVIYLYSVNIRNRNEIRWNELNRLSKDNNLEIKVTVGTGIYPGFEIYGDEVDYEYCSVEKWLCNISNSKYVISTSFHGIVFSIIMETPFVYIPFTGERSRLNERIFELLELVGLENRILYPNITYEQILESEINWNSVKRKLLKFRQYSKKYLMNNLKCN